MIKKILTLDNVPVINKKIGKVDTIEKLKASTIYSLGDIVDLNGYYTAGDGAHHKRKIESADDGSGVQLANGLWANIVTELNMFPNTITGDYKFVTPFQEGFVENKDNAYVGASFFYDGYIYNIYYPQSRQSDRIKDYILRYYIDYELGVVVRDKTYFKETPLVHVGSVFLDRATSKIYLTDSKLSGVYETDINFSNFKEITSSIKPYGVCRQGDNFFFVSSGKFYKTDLNFNILGSFSPDKSEDFAIMQDATISKGRYYINLGYGHIPSPNLSKHQYSKIAIFDCNTLQLMKTSNLHLGKDRNEPEGLTFDETGNKLFITSHDLSSPRGSRVDVEYLDVVDFENPYGLKLGYNAYSYEITVGNDKSVYDFTELMDALVYARTLTRSEQDIHYNVNRMVKVNIMTDIVCNKFLMLEGLEQGIAILNPTGTKKTITMNNYSESYQCNLYSFNSSLNDFFENVTFTSSIFRIERNSYLRVDIGCDLSKVEIKLDDSSILDMSAITSNESLPTNYYELSYSNSIYNPVLKERGRIKKISLSSSSFWSSEIIDCENKDVIHIEIYPITEQGQILDIKSKFKNIKPYSTIRIAKSQLKITPLKVTGLVSPVSFVEHIVDIGNYYYGVIDIVFKNNGFITGSGLVKKVESTFATTDLNTPYYAYKMQQEGVYEDFVAYMDSKLAHDKEQRYLEEQRQLAFESREDQEQTYEEWLVAQPVLIPDNEPQPSEKLLEFKNKYIV